MNYDKTEAYPDNQSRFYYGYVIVAVSLMLMLVSYGTRGVFGIFFKPIISEFGWSRALISGAFSISIGIEGIAGILMGGLNDRFGPRAVLTFSGLFIGAGYLLISQLNALWQLYVFYGIIVGIGMGGIIVPLASTVARWFTVRRGIMTGIAFSGMHLGGVIFPPLANQFISVFGWRFSYLILGGLVLVIIIPLAQLLQRDPARNGLSSYDGGQESRHEKVKSDTELSLREAFCTNQFWKALFIVFCFGFPAFGIWVHFVPYMTDLGISGYHAAITMSIEAGTAVIGGIIIGRGADRIGIRPVFILCFIMLTIGFLCLIPARSVLIFFLLGFFLGIAYGGIDALISPLTAWLFGLKSHGLILGTMSLSLTVGGALGAAVMGYIFDVTKSYHYAFLLCAVFPVTGILLLTLIAPSENKKSV